MDKLKAVIISDAIRTFAGTATSLYYDLFAATSSPEVLQQASVALAASIPDDVTVIVAPGMGAAGLAAAVALALLPRVVSILNLRDPSKAREGEWLVQGIIPKENSKAVFLDDTITTGDTYRLAIETLRQNAPQVTITCVSLLFDSWTLQSRRIRASGIPMFACVRRHDVGLSRDEVSNTTADAVKTPALTNKLADFRAANLDNTKAKSSPVLLADRIITADGSHTVRANAYDGKQLWSWQGTNPKSKGVLQNLQVQPDNTLIVAGYSGAVAKLTLDGEQIWETVVASTIHSTPRVDSDGTIYVACEEWNRATKKPGGSLVSLSPDGVQLQKAQYSDEFAPARCTVLDAAVIVTANDSILRSLDKKDFAKQLWSTTLPGKVRGEVLHNEGLLYCATESGHVLCVNATTGEIVWVNRISRSFYHSLPMLSSGRVVVTDTTFYAHAINTKTGVREWITKFRSRVVHRPTVISDNRWLFCGRDGDVHVVDPTTGDKLGQTRTGRGLLQPAAYFDGKVGLMTANGTVQIWELNSDLRS